jgi:GT2 family glycosyltransferase/spore maturation protein CgeB
MPDVREYEALLEAAALRTELDELRVRLSAARAQAVDRTQWIRIAELERSLAAAQMERDAALREAERAGQKADTQRSKLDALEARLAALEAERARAELERERTAAELERAKGRLREAGEEQAAVQAAAQAAMQELDRELRAELETVLSQRDELAMREQALRVELDEAVTEHHARLAELDEAATEHHARLAELDEAATEDRVGLERAADRVSLLETERDQLSHEVTRLTEQAHRGADLLAQAKAQSADDQELRGRELAELRAVLERAHADSVRLGTEYQARIRELEQSVSTLAAGLNETREDIDRAAASRAWRYGHGAMRALTRLTMRREKTAGALAAAIARIDAIATSTRVLSLEFPPPRLATEASPKALLPRAHPVPGDRSLLASEIRLRLGEAPQRGTWPPVSIVVLTRDGREHMMRLLDGLRNHTDYPEFELVAVDNASADGTAELLGSIEAPFPVVVIHNDENLTFSEANAQGAAKATHDLLLFLNNDVEPFERGWLKELVDAVQQDGTVAAGARLLHSERHGLGAAQHRAIRFRQTADGPRAYNEGDGDHAFGPGFGHEVEAPAVTAACMLIRRADFDAVGGFIFGYRYGTEDVDLGLKLTASGRRVIGTGRALLIHDESSTQRTEARAVVRQNRLLNRRIFLERWGPQVRREYRVARLRHDPFWTDGSGPHIAITVTDNDVTAGWGDWYTAHELGDQLEHRGWKVSYAERRGDHWYELPYDLDYVLTLMDPFDARRVPDHVVTIAWIRNWTDRWIDRPWFERLDLLLASSAGSADRIAERTGRQSVLFPLATNPARFSPTANGGGRRSDVVFTGNRWGIEREIETGFRSVAPAGLAIYGKGWDELEDAKKHAHGPASYEELPSIYAGASVVLDDAQAPCLPYGALNSRVFDALAAGSLVITNCASGVHELFDHEFPTWTAAEEIGGTVHQLLHDDERRSRLVRRYRRKVLTEHTYAHRAELLGDQLLELERSCSFCIKIGAPTWEQAERWGDLHFARAFARALRYHGHRSKIQVLSEWEDADGLYYDVVIHLKGLSRYSPKPGQFNILWCISHPDKLSGEECDGYDLVCVASRQFAEELAARTSTPVRVLEQATDQRIFYPDTSPEYDHELVYVANSRNVLRPIMRDLLPTEHDLVVYGSGWDGLIDPRLVRDAFIPNEELRKVYSSARIVLADHWDDMRMHGFISNRIYDAVACGAFVISDDVPGLVERFGDRVAVYRSPEELRELIAARLAAPPAQVASPVLAGKFSDRVAELLEALGSTAGWPALRLSVRGA